MSKIVEAIHILTELGLPRAQQRMHHICVPYFFLNHRDNAKNHHKPDNQNGVVHIPIFLIIKRIPADIFLPNQVFDRFKIDLRESQTGQIAHAKSDHAADDIPPQPGNARHIVFAVLRTSPSGDETILCLQNVTADSQIFNVDSKLINAGGEFQDLLSNRLFASSKINLGPYQTCWLRTSSEI